VVLTTTAGGASATDLLDKRHPVTNELAGAASVYFSAPRLLYPFDVRGIRTTDLVQLPLQPLYDRLVLGPPEMGTVILAAERGSTVADDLGFRPGRLLVVGDATFITNRYLLNHASANRDLAINTVRWLTGLSGSGARGATNVLSLDISQRHWHILYLVMGALLPLVFCIVIRLLLWRGI
jgi:hypothetical protein